MSRMRCVMPMEPVLNTRTWQREEAMAEYLDCLIFLGMPFEEAPESEAYAEPPIVAVKSESIDSTTSDQALNGGVKVRQVAEENCDTLLIDMLVSGFLSSRLSFQFLSFC